jgi:hypothetical protein
LGTPPASDVTQLLLEWRQGEAGALDRLLPLVDAELRRITHARMRGETPGDHTFQTTSQSRLTLVLTDCVSSD